MDAAEGADPGILGYREKFLTRTVERLGVHPTDFASSAAAIARRGAAPRRAAGVLVPLLFQPSLPGSGFAGGEFYFQLIKRSQSVPQPGDLSCPGGMVHPLLDRLLCPLLHGGLLPVLRGPARLALRRRDAPDRRWVTLFLTNALRESWEEIRLSPCRVRFLGPLPTFSLTRFRTTIFPSAGFVERPGPLSPNREVEKILEIPLRAFHRQESFGCLSLAVSDPAGKRALAAERHPCLIHRGVDGTEEILWGATLYILVEFLQIVMDYRMPPWENGRAFRRTIGGEYLTGSPLPERSS